MRQSVNSNEVVPLLPARRFPTRALAGTGLLCLLLVPVMGLAEEENYTASVDIKYPGNYRLTYYYTPESPDKQHPAKVKVQDKEFIVDPGIRPPTINGVFLLEHSEVHAGESVLDIGTGTGIHAIFAADKTTHIVATDLDPKAIANAKRNARLHGVADNIDFRVGDLFAPLKEGEKFDVIYFNIAYPIYNHLPQPWELHERLFAGIRKYMKPYARIYYQAGYVQNIPYIHDMVTRNQLSIMRMDMVNATFYKNELILFVIQ
jgi:SAM-dependent methyltransferase